MQKQIIAAATYYKKKIFFDETFSSIPSAVQIEVKELCKLGAEMAQGIFTIGFDNAGNITFEASSEDDDFDFDEINARIVTDKLVKDSTELVKSLQLWHALYMTEQGRALKEKLIQSSIRDENNRDESS